jgi:hypothetical protein
MDTHLTRGKNLLTASDVVTALNSYFDLHSPEIRAYHVRFNLKDLVKPVYPSRMFANMASDVSTELLGAAPAEGATESRDEVRLTIKRVPDSTQTEQFVISGIAPLREALRKDDTATIVEEAAADVVVGEEEEEEEEEEPIVAEEGEEAGEGEDAHELRRGPKHVRNALIA